MRNRPYQWIRAWCLDPDKAKPGHEELVIGPCQSIGITWDFVRAAGIKDTDDFEHVLIRDESGFWYPVVCITRGNGGNLLADYRLGRYTDITFLTEAPSLATPPTREPILDMWDLADRQLWEDASISEMEWLSAG